MANMLKYRGYHGSVEFSEEDGLLVGSVFGIRDSLCYHGKSVEEIEDAFHDCVDTYLELCQKHNREPDKEYRGTFNIRISPDLHRQAALEAEKEGISLNQFIQNAVEEKLMPSRYEKIVYVVPEVQRKYEISAVPSTFRLDNYSRSATPLLA